MNETYHYTQENNEDEETPGLRHGQQYEDAQALLEHLPDGVVVVNRQGIVQFVNPAASRLLGWPSAELVGHSLDFAIAEQSIAEVEIQRPDGSTRIVEVRSTEITWQKATAYLAIIRDVTDDRRAEKKLEAERLLRTLYTSVRTLAESFDMHRVAQEVTRICVETFGARLAWIGQAKEDGRVVVVAWYPPNDPYPHSVDVRWDETPGAQGPAGRAIRTGQPQVTENIANDPEFLPWRERALECGFKCHAAYPLTSRGRTFGALNIYSTSADFFTEDVQEVLQALADLAATALENARLYEQVTDMNRELRAALQARDDMLRNVSHELRTPLTMVRGYIELISTGLISDPREVKATASIALKHALHLQYLIDRLLLLQRLRYRRLEMVPVDVEQWLRTTVTAWGRRLKEDGIEINLKVTPEVGKARGDLASLQQVIDELVDNARKFSPDDGKITISAWADNHEVYISISDTGVGIPREELSRIFERFYQVDSSSKRQFDGMGIGLAVVKEIVERHGGRVWAESAGIGRGATITFTLPRAV